MVQVGLAEKPTSFLRGDENRAGTQSAGFNI